MKRIERQTPEEQRIYNDTLLFVRQTLKGIDIFKSLVKHQEFTYYTFIGKQNDEVLQKLGRWLSNDELILIIHGSSKHYGAACMCEGGRFSGRINTEMV